MRNLKSHLINRSSFYNISIYDISINKPINLLLNQSKRAKFFFYWSVPRHKQITKNNQGVGWEKNMIMPIEFKPWSI